MTRREPGCTFAVAPRFEPPADWQGRLLIGTGVEEIDGHFFPRGPWRPPTAEELSHLTGNAAAEATSSPARAELFRLPAHLCARWWELLQRASTDSAGTGGGPLPGYDAFVAQIADFLTFKGLPIDGPASCDVVVSRPGQRSIRWDAAGGRALGLGCTLPPQTPCPSAESSGVPRLWGAINLGDEATSFVLVTLPCRLMAETLRRDFPEHDPAATLGALAQQFLRARPEVPLARAILHPGEGLRLPHDAMLVDGFPQDKREPDVLLLLTELGEAVAKRQALREDVDCD